MAKGPRSRRRWIATSCTVALLVSWNAPFASAQQDNRSSAVVDVAKSVIFDPTTYAPALIQYDATMRDWNTSQPFFQNGHGEQNPRFTISGLPDDPPLSWAAGRSLILRDTMSTLGVAAAQNLASHVVERALLARYPEHPKLVRTIGWVQRIALASLMSYNLSAVHYRQAALNARRARELGYR